MGACGSAEMSDDEIRGSRSSQQVRVAAAIQQENSKQEAKVLEQEHSRKENGGNGRDAAATDGDQGATQEQNAQGSEGGHEPSQSRSQSRSRSRSRSSRRRRKKRHQQQEPLEVMDGITEEKRNVLDDPASMSYQPVIIGSTTLPGFVKQASTSSGTSLPSFQNSSSSDGAKQQNGQPSAVQQYLNELECVVVLVVDEDESTQAVLEKWLSQDRKYQIVPCCSGDEAIEVLASSELDEENLVSDISFIIADANLTAPTGELLLDAIKSDKTMSDIPFILMCTEGTSTQATDRMIRRGATDVIHKPLNKVSLLNSIDTLFRTRMDSKKIDVLRDKGDEYKQELVRERRQAQKEIGSLANKTLSAFTVGQGSELEAIHVLLIDDDCSIDPITGTLILSDQAKKINDWIASMILNVLIAPSCEAGIEMLDEMAQRKIIDSPNQAQIGTRHINGAGAMGNTNNGNSGGGFHGIQPSGPSTGGFGYGGGTISRALGEDGHSGGGITQPFKQTLFGIELIIFDFALLEKHGSSSSGPSASGTADARLLIQRILNQPESIPLVLLVDDISDVGPEYLQQLKSCSVTFIQKPLGKDSLSKKIGLIVESIQLHRQKQRFAYRASSYRVLLQKLRERKKTLGLNNRDSIGGGSSKANTPTTTGAITGDGSVSLLDMSHETPPAANRAASIETGSIATLKLAKSLPRTAHTPTRAEDSDTEENDPNLKPVDLSALPNFDDPPPQSSSQNLQIPTTNTTNKRIKVQKPN